jgi:hypothetical protein
MENLRLIPRPSFVFIPVSDERIWSILVLILVYFAVSQVLVEWYAFSVIILFCCYLSDSFEGLVLEVEVADFLNNSTECGNKTYHGYGMKELTLFDTCDGGANIRPPAKSRVKLHLLLDRCNKMWEVLKSMHEDFRLIAGIYLGIIFPLTMSSLIPRLTFGIVNPSGGFDYCLKLTSTSILAARVIILIEMGHQFHTRVRFADLIRGTLCIKLIELLCFFAV